MHTVLPVRGDAVPTGEAQAVPDVRRHQIARLPQGAVCRGTPASAAYLPGAGGISQGLPMEGEVLCQCQAPHRVWAGPRVGRVRAGSARAYIGPTGLISECCVLVLFTPMPICSH